MKRKTKILISGVVVVLVGYVLFKYLTPEETAEANAPSPDGGGDSENEDDFFSDIASDVFGLDNQDEAEFTDTQTPDLTGSSANGCFTNIDILEPLPDSLGCFSGSVNPSNCKGSNTCIPGFAGTPTNACGPGVARWQKTLNTYYKDYGDGQCIPATDFGKATSQTNAKTQSLIDASLISLG